MPSVIAMYYIAPIVFLFVILISIIIRENKKSLRADEIVVYSVRTFNWEIMGFILVLGMQLFAFNMFYGNYVDAHKVLIPEYFDHWYQILWLENLYEIGEYFREQEMLSESIRVSMLIRSLQTLLSTSVAFVGGFESLYRGLQRAEIGEETVYTNKANIDWYDVIVYQWQNPEPYRGGQKYNLKLTYHSRSSFRKIFSPDDSVYIPIAEEDKDKVDELLAEKVYE